MRLNGPWDEEQVVRHLERSVIPVRLGCLDDANWPSVFSLWFEFEDSALWCATPAAARAAAWLAREPRCAFEIAPNERPYFGVRGRGRATLIPDQGDAVLRRLAQRYLGNDPSAFSRWLLGRRVPEVAIRIAPERITSWDFRERMRDA